MKIASTVAGSVLLLIGLLNVIRYISDYNVLAPYGKGFVFGNVLLMALGIMALFYGLRKGDSPSKSINRSRS